MKRNPLKYYLLDNRKAFYIAKVTEQKHKCAICGKQTKLLVDHDQVTGLMRGLLCHTHNRALGLFQDSPDLLVTAADYLLLTAAPKADTPNPEQLLLLKLLNDDSFVSDRARSKAFAEQTHCNPHTAYTKLYRFKRKLNRHAPVHGT